MELTLGALTFAFTVSLAHTLRYLALSRRRTLVERVVGEEEDDEERVPELADEEATARIGFLARLEREARQAGLRVQVRDLLLVLFAAATLGFLVAYLLTGSVMLAAGALLLGYYAPRLYLARLKQQRVRAFEKQFEHALTQMANALRAGSGLMNAVADVGRTMPDPIGYEFRRAYQQMRLGTSQQEALRQIGERVDSEDYQVFLTALDLQLETGGNLIESFERIAATIRDREAAREAVRSKTAQQQFSAAIISGMPVALVAGMLVFKPGYMSIFTSSFGGRVILTACLGAIALGWMWVRKIVNIRFE